MIECAFLSLFGAIILSALTVFLGGVLIRFDNSPQRPWEKRFENWVERRDG